MGVKTFFITSKCNGVVELTRKAADFPRRVLTIGGDFLFTQVNIWPRYDKSKVKYSQIRLFRIFSSFYLKNINRSDTKLSSACSRLNSGKEVSLRFLHQIFVTCRIDQCDVMVPTAACNSVEEIVLSF